MEKKDERQRQGGDSCKRAQVGLRRNRSRIPRRNYMCSNERCYSSTHQPWNFRDCRSWNFRDREEGIDEQRLLHFLEPSGFPVLGSPLPGDREHIHVPESCCDGDEFARKRALKASQRSHGTCSRISFRENLHGGINHPQGALHTFPTPLVCSQAQTTDQGQPPSGRCAPSLPLSLIHI